MTTTPTQHEADRLADELVKYERDYVTTDFVADMVMKSAEHLRRIPTLEAENAELKARLSAMTADRNSWHGQCSDLAALLSELDAQRVPLTDAWQDVSAA